MEEEKSISCFQISVNTLNYFIRRVYNFSGWITKSFTKYMFYVKPHLFTWNLILAYKQIAYDALEPKLQHPIFALLVSRFYTYQGISSFTTKPNFYQSYCSS